MTINDGILINKYTSSATVQSKIAKLSSVNTAIVAKIDGSGLVGATLNVYGGIYSESDGTWHVKVLDKSYQISDQAGVILKDNLTTLSSYIQFEVVGLSGTNATITAAFINAS